MLIYTEHDTPRFRYAVRRVLSNYEGEINFASSIEAFRAHSGPRIFYGGEGVDVKNECDVVATSIIWKKSIEEILPSARQWHNVFAFDFSGHGSFDIFASSFYMLSRYEEYVTKERDTHQRFAFASAGFSDSKYIHRPVVDLWRKKYEEILSKQFPGIRFRENRFEVKATIDVDSAFAYAHKGIKRTLGGIAKDILSLRWGNLASRMGVLLDSEKDPFKTYAYISDTCRKKNVPLHWFFLLSDFGGEDINVPHTSESLRNLILELSGKNAVGIHPGYASNDDDGKLATEISRLSEIIGKEVTDSRQHYLRLSLPHTYRKLIDAGIRNDHTMGYADEVGFRAGTSMPFPWFDLEENYETGLVIYPFAVMDATLRSYLKLSAEESIEVISRLKKDVESTGGVFTTLWHNDTLSETGKWKGWRKVWEAGLD